MNAPLALPGDLFDSALNHLAVVPEIGEKFRKDGVNLFPRSQSCTPWPEFALPAQGRIAASQNEFAYREATRLRGRIDEGVVNSAAGIDSLIAFRKIILLPVTRVTYEAIHFLSTIAALNPSIGQAISAKGRSV